jgi:hypothetical protein
MEGSKSDKIDPPTPDPDEIRAREEAAARELADADLEHWARRAPSAPTPPPAPVATSRAWPLTTVAVVGVAVAVAVAAGWAASRPAAEPTPVASTPPATQPPATKRSIFQLEPAPSGAGQKALEEPVPPSPPSPPPAPLPSPDREPTAPTSGPDPLPPPGPVPLPPPASSSSSGVEFVYRCPKCNRVLLTQRFRQGQQPKPHGGTASCPCGGVVGLDRLPGSAPPPAATDPPSSERPSTAAELRAAERAVAKREAETKKRTAQVEAALRPIVERWYVAREIGNFTCRAHKPVGCANCYAQESLAGVQAAWLDVLSPDGRRQAGAPGPYFVRIKQGKVLAGQRGIYEYVRRGEVLGVRLEECVVVVRSRVIWYTAEAEETEHESRWILRGGRFFLAFDGERGERLLPD